MKDAMLALAIAMLMCVSGLFAFSLPTDNCGQTAIVGTDATRGHPAVFEDFKDEGNGAEGGTRTTLSDSELPSYNNWCKGWKLKMLSGANKDIEREISDYYSLTHTVSVSTPFPNPIQAGDLYRIYLTEYDMKNLYFLCCQNMTGDVHYIDVVPHIANGDSDNIGYPGLNKEDLNLTYTSVSPMNFSYPRTGMSAQKKGLYAKYDPTCTPFCNITVNGLGLIDPQTREWISPTGIDKLLSVEVWFDTDGDYDIIKDEGDIEGIMDFDFDQSIPDIQPYRTTCKPLTGDPIGTYPYGKNAMQAEEYADGVGVWRGGPPGDMNSGQIFVMLYRADMKSDDDNNATADFIVYCGSTSKLSWFNLPYKHPEVIPHADAGADQGFNNTLGQIIVRERTDVYFDGTGSWDPQDDSGMDGIAFGDPGWTAPDTFEGTENIENGDPSGEAVGETDTLQYKWSWGVGTQDSGWLSTPHAIHQFTLPSKVPFMIYKVTLTVRDPQMHTDTDYCYVQVWDDPGTPPVPTISVSPDETPSDHEATVLAGQEFEVTGFALDMDEGQTLSYYWDLDNTDPAHEPSDISEFLGVGDRNGTTSFTMVCPETKDLRLTLNVFDGPIGGDDTLNATAYYIVHLVNNTPPSGTVVARTAPGSEAIAGQAYVRDYDDLYFEVLASDPDLRPGFDPDNDHAIDYQVQYKWDFGDGKTVEWTTQEKMSHNYSGKGSANNGYAFYTVSVMVRDGPEKDPNSNVVALAPFKVYVNIAPVAEAGSDLPSIEQESNIQALDIVQFDASRSFDPNDDLDGDCVIDGAEVDNLQYAWDFGDGDRGEGRGPTHIYQEAGVYSVQLTVKDAGGRTGTDSLTVTVVEIPATPVIDVSVGTQEGSGGGTGSTMVDGEITVLTKEDIVFDATGSYTPDGQAYNDGKESTDPTEDLLFVWEFGPDSRTSAPKVTYSYPEDGDYTVTLTVMDKAHKRAPSVVLTILVHVLNRAPVSDIGNYEDRVKQTEPAIFDARESYDQDGSVAQYHWDFGDEYKSGWLNESKTRHEYEKPGKYKVKLIVRDNDGAESVAAEGNITVYGTEPPPPDTPWMAIAIAVLAVLVLIAIGIGVTYVVMNKIKQ